MRGFTRYILCLAVLLAAGCFSLEAAPAPTGPPPADIPTEMLLDYSLVSADGKQIGPIHGMVINPETGVTDYVVVLLKDQYHYGKGADGPPDDNYLLIPWSHLKLDTAQRKLIADVDAAVLDKVPILDDLPTAFPPNWDMALRRFWAGQ